MNSKFILIENIKNDVESLIDPETSKVICQTYNDHRLTLLFVLFKRNRKKLKQ